jgi:hypothetical protein
LWPANDLTPATTQEKQAALAKIRCTGDLCHALLLPPTGQCAALVHQDDRDLTVTGSGDCPGDAGFSVVSIPAGQRLRRLLWCGKRDGAMESYNTNWAPAGPPNCGTILLFTRGQARAWIERLDASTSTALVSAKLADMPASLKRGGGRWHVFAGQDPTDDGDDGAGLENESVDAGP